MRLSFLKSVAARRLLFTACYFSEGAPIGFIWWALPTKLHAAGVSVEATASLSALLVLPWVFKFLWAPLIDVGRTARWGHRSWILTLQLLMGITLVPLLILDFETEFGLLTGFLFVHALFAATQDAAIDAFAIASVPVQERGSLNGWMQVGMLLGRSVLGGGALVLEGVIGSTSTVLMLIGAIWFSSIAILLSPLSLEQTLHTGALPDRVREFSGRLRGVLTSKRTWMVLLFAATGGAAFEGVGAVAGPFLLDHGFSKEDIGMFFSVPAVVGMMGGALGGGVLADRFERRRAVAIALLFVVLAVCGLAAAALSTNSAARLLLPGLLGVLYVFIGMFTATSYTMFMDATTPELGATQFSACMGATNGCELWSVFVVGKLQAAFGYSIAFSVLAMASLLALWILKGLRLPSQTPGNLSGPSPS